MAGNPRVLVVDQDFEARAELQKGLVRARFLVVAGVGYGAEALSLASQMKPQVVLVGVGEPAARALQTIESLTSIVPDAPIIAYSHLKDAESARRAVLAGARDYLTKPLKMEEVIRAIELALSRQEKRQALLAGQPGLAVRTGGMIVTIFGAKGGVGKTTLATNLATALAAMTDGSTVLVDMDTVFGDVAMMMDIPVDKSLVDVANQIEEMDRESLVKYLTGHATGVRILPAPFEPMDWRLLNPECVEKALDLLAQTHDFVVIDTPATFTDLVAVALEQATVILLLTSLDMSSLRDTTVALKLFNKASYSPDKIKLVVNHPTSVNSFKEGDISKVLHQEVFWSIPYDEEVSASIQLGTPVVAKRPDSRVAQNVAELAALLSGLEPTSYSGDGREEPVGGGLLRKIFRR